MPGWMQFREDTVREQVWGGRKGYGRVQRFRFGPGDSGVGVLDDRVRVGVWSLRFGSTGCA